MEGVTTKENETILHQVIVRPLLFIFWLIISCIYPQYSSAAFVFGVYELADQKPLRTLNFSSVFFIIFLINYNINNNQSLIYYLLQSIIIMIGLMIWSGFWLEIKSRWLSLLNIISSFILSFVVFVLMNQTYLYILLAINLIIVIDRKNLFLVSLSFIGILIFLLLKITQPI